MGNKYRHTVMAWVLECALVAATVCCTQKHSQAIPEAEEDQVAMQLMQGIWLDNETENVAFRVMGDTVYYPDAANMPSHFSIVGDTLLMGAPQQKYPIQQLSENTFWFCNSNGDLVKLTKSSDTTNVLAFVSKQTAPAVVNEVLKRDTVVTLHGERYHCYVAINPTKYKVVSIAYNDDGVAVERIYYDNIVHLSVFHGTKRLYGRDLRKSMFSHIVPEQFLSQAILADINYDGVQQDKFHFSASLCLPDAASCYVVGIDISVDGQMTMHAK